MIDIDVLGGGCSCGSPTSHVPRPAHRVLLGDMIGLDSPRHEDNRKTVCVCERGREMRVSVNG